MCIGRECLSKTVATNSNNNICSMYYLCITLQATTNILQYDKISIFNDSYDNNNKLKIAPIPVTNLKLYNFTTIRVKAIPTNVHWRV